MSFAGMPLRARYAALALIAAGFSLPARAEIICGPVFIPPDFVEEICIDSRECPSAFGPEADLCAEACSTSAFPPEGCEPPQDPEEVCGLDRILDEDGFCVPCGPDQEIIDNECIDLPPPPIRCLPNQILVDGACVSDPGIPEIGALIDAGFVQDLALYLVEEAPGVLTRLDELLRRETPRRTDRQLDTALFATSQALTDLECEGRSAGQRCKSIDGVCREPGVNPRVPTCVPTEDAAAELASQFLGMTLPLPPRDPCVAGDTPLCQTTEDVVAAGLDLTLARLLNTLNPELLEDILAFIRDPRVRANVRASDLGEGSPEFVDEILGELLFDLSQFLLTEECSGRSDQDMCRNLPGICVEPGLVSRSPICIPTSISTLDLLSDSLGLPPVPDPTGKDNLIDLIEQRRQDPGPDAARREMELERLEACLDDPACDVGARGLLALIGTDSLVPAVFLQSLSRQDLLLAAEARLLVAEEQSGFNARLLQQEIAAALVVLDLSSLTTLASGISALKPLLDLLAQEPPVGVLITVLGEILSDATADPGFPEAIDLVALRTAQAGLEMAIEAICRTSRISAAPECVLDPGL